MRVFFVPYTINTMSPYLIGYVDVGHIGGGFLPSLQQPAPRQTTPRSSQGLQLARHRPGNLLPGLDADFLFFTVLGQVARDVSALKDGGVCRGVRQQRR
jgi:hypothetical protein